MFQNFSCVQQTNCYVSYIIRYRFPIKKKKQQLNTPSGNFHKTTDSYMLKNTKNPINTAILNKIVTTVNTVTAVKWYFRLADFNEIVSITSLENNYLNF